MTGQSSTYFRPQMSLYVPYVISSTNEEQIKNIFLALNIGMVSRVDFVERENDYTKCMAFIHFEYWFVNDTSYHIQERIQNTGTSRIVYNDPYYWIIMENKNPRTQNEVFLEKQVATLNNRVQYLETVIATHTKKFIDNGISLKNKNCDGCWIEMPLDAEKCIPCGYNDDYDDDMASQVTDRDMLDLENSTPSMDLRTALKNGDVALTLNNDESTTPLPPIPKPSQDNVETSWNWW